MNYQEYLKSDDWKCKRDERRAIDGKCAICGSIIDLNVHHLTYKTFPDESASDLITLCRYHHEIVENRKNSPGSDSFHIVKYMMVEHFIKEYEHLDYSSGGNIDLCNLNIIKRYLYPFFREHGFPLNSLSGSSAIQRYFRNKRYGIILDYIERGFPLEVARTRVRFSDQMLRKVYSDPQKARRIMQEQIF